jgi:hypothetical protein
MNGSLVRFKRTVRRQRAETGLDSDPPAYPPLAQATGTKALELTVDVGDQGKLIAKEDAH